MRTNFCGVSYTKSAVRKFVKFRTSMNDRSTVYSCTLTIIILIYTQTQFKKFIDHSTNKPFTEESIAAVFLEFDQSHCVIKC